MLLVLELHEVILQEQVNLNYEMKLLIIKEAQILSKMLQGDKIHVR